MRAASLESIQSATLRALWFALVPASLTALALEFLVPGLVIGEADGALGFLARVGRAYPVPLGAGLFLVFAALVRYWRFYLPGARYFLRLPAGLSGRRFDVERLRIYSAAAQLHQTLATARMRRRLGRSLTVQQEAEVSARLSDLTRGLETDDEGRVRDAVRRLETLAAPALAAEQRSDAVKLLLSMALAALLALGLRAKVVGAYTVLSASMLPTLEPGDVVAGSKVVYALPHRGDVIVFPPAAVPMPQHPSNPEFLVKRVVGLPGDRIAMRGGSPVINGWVAPTCDAGPYFYAAPGGEGPAIRARLLVEFLDDKAYLIVRSPEQPAFDPYEVQPGEVFVLGDNRNNSLDSRSWNDGHGGGVPLSAIAARVRWFLLGTRRSGGADLGRIFRPVDHGHVHLDGVDTRALDEGVARCLRERPKDTHPPAR